MNVEVTKALLSKDFLQNIVMCDKLEYKSYFSSAQNLFFYMPK